MAKATTLAAVPKKNDSKESLAASVPIPGDHGGEDLESHPESKPAVLTRDDQLRLKATNKEDRKQKAKANKTKGKKGKKGKKQNKGRGNKALTEPKSPTKAPMSRKRKMMKKQTSQDEKTLDVKCAEPKMIEKPQKKPRKIPTGSSADVPKKRSKPEAEAVDQVEAVVDEKQPRKRKTRPAEPEGKVSKAKPKPKAKAKAKAKVKAAPKKGAAPKAKASATKPKAKGRPKKDRKDDFMERSRESEKFKPGQLKMLENFAKSFDPELDVKSNAFKQEARGHIPPLSTYRLNIYWTRTSVGVTDVKSNRDVVHFSFNTSSACSVHKIAVALGCAMHAVA